MRTKSLHSCLLLALLALTPPLHAATNTVLIGSYFFNPTNMTVNIGDTVLWTNTVAGTTTHDATRTNSPLLWASGDLTAAKRTYSMVFNSAGAYFYFCNTHVYAFNIANRHPEQTGSVTVASITLNPSVTLTNPANNARFRAPANLQLQATASEPGGSITNVQFYSGATPLGNVTSPPYNLAVNNLAATNYSFTARASDALGTVATSAVLNVFVLTNAVLTAPARLPGGQFKFTIQGIAGQSYATESSANLTNWSAFATNIAPASTFNVTDFTSTNVLLRYYRARQDL